MTASKHIFAAACTELIGQVATNDNLAKLILSSIENGNLKPDSGPMAIGKVLKGSAGKYHLSSFLDAWKNNAAHLTAQDVCCSLVSALDCYQLAIERSHRVDTVWTGPEVVGSMTRRTEAVVNEIIAEAKSEILIVGYWLVTSTVHMQELIESLIAKARAGVKIRFVFDPSEKSQGLDNFSALNSKWPADMKAAQREVFSWCKAMEKVSSNKGLMFDRKLHAKVIVADRHDALVTSANLTQAGMLQNLEMGFRVEGYMASAVVAHFDLLISEGILEHRN